MKSCGSRGSQQGEMKGLEHVRLYAVFEHSYRHSAPEGNPFDVPVEAAFQHERGARVHVEGFYDGDDLYRVRFMPSQVGRWDYRVVIEERVIEKGTIVCVPSDIKGPLQQDEQHPYHFVFSSGQPFYMLGNTAYNALVAYRNARKAFCQFLDYYAARGFNWTRFSLHQAVWATLGRVVWPWGGTPEEPDFATFDLQTFRDAEGTIQEMAAHNMIASVILLHRYEQVLIDPVGDVRMRACKKYFRYAVARLSAYWNVVWNVANEWQIAYVFAYDEIDELGYWLHTIDPYQRLTACHHYGRFEFYDKEWTDMSSLQHRGLPHEINRVMRQNRRFSKITINEEYGYEGDNHSPPNDPDNVRYDHWAIAMAGGYGTYGDKTKGDKVGVYYTSVLQDAMGTSVPDALQHLKAFMEKTGYRSMAPANVFLSDCDPRQAFCLADPGQEYIVYLVRGQSFKLNLTHVHGTLSVRWYNPRTGKWIPSQNIYVAQSIEELPDDERGERSWTGFARQQALAFQSPDNENDWVLHLTKMGQREYVG